jgi:hypothetical protein
MASLKQLEANRENAKRSIGPKSQAGKARSRLNSRKHGLTAKMLVIVGENADDFDALRAELTEQHEEERAFNLPLSREALELVDRVLRSHNSAWLFPSDPVGIWRRSAPTPESSAPGPTRTARP